MDRWKYLAAVAVALSALLLLFVSTFPSTRTVSESFDGDNSTDIFPIAAPTNAAPQAPLCDAYNDSSHLAQEYRGVKPLINPKACSKYAYMMQLYIGGHTYQVKDQLLTYTKVVETLCYQLKIVHKTRADVFVYTNVPYNLTAANRTLLLELGCYPIHFPMPFEVAEIADGGVRAQAAISLGQLNAWRMIQYERIINLDADMIVQRPIDHLFQLPEMSAVSDVTSAMNNGMWVMKPNLTTYYELRDFWRTAKYSCQGINHFDPVKKPVMFGGCINDAGPQGIYPAFFYPRGYFQLSEIHNFVVSSQTGLQWWFYLEEIYLFHLINCKPWGFAHRAGKHRHQIALCDVLRPYFEALHAAAERRAITPPPLPVFNQTWAIPLPKVHWDKQCAEFKCVTTQNSSSPVSAPKA